MLDKRQQLLDANLSDSERRKLVVEMSRDGEGAKILINEVTEKSAGVFLWVRLVVKSLLEGLRDGDTLEDLQARLVLLPRDLEALFKKILDDLDPAYFEEASQFLQIVRASHISRNEVILSAKAYVHQIMEMRESREILCYFKRGVKWCTKKGA